MRDQPDHDLEATGVEALTLPNFNFFQQAPAFHGRFFSGNFISALCVFIQIRSRSSEFGKVAHF